MSFSRQFANSRTQHFNEHSVGLAKLPVKRLQARLIACAGYPIIAALGSTFRWRAEGAEHLDARRAQRAAADSWPSGTAYSSRHRLLSAARGIVVITSENFDGDGSPASSSASATDRARLRPRARR